MCLCMYVGMYVHTMLVSILKKIQEKDLVSFTRIIFQGFSEERLGDTFGVERIIAYNQVAFGGVVAIDLEHSHDRG